MFSQMLTTKSYTRPLLIILTLCSGFQAVAQTDEVAVKATVTRLFDGMRKSDTAMIRSAFAPKAILQSVAKNRSGVVSIRNEALDSFLISVATPHTGIYDERIVFETVKIDGDLATVWTPYKFYVGEKFSHCGANSFQMVRLNGEWKIQFLIDTRRRQDCDKLPGF